MFIFFSLNSLITVSISPTVVVINADKAITSGLIFSASSTILADSFRLSQVIINLLSNAIKYNKNGGSVEISYQESTAKKIRLQVKDSGIGISEADQQMLFQPFNRLGLENSNIEGTGIGLHIAKSLIEQMNGKLTFSSQLNIGTTFIIELPRAS